MLPGDKPWYSCDFCNRVVRCKSLHNRSEYCPDCQQCREPASFPFRNSTCVPGFPRIRRTGHRDISAGRCEYRNSTAFHMWHRKGSRPFGCIASVWWIFRSRNFSAPSPDTVDMVRDGKAMYMNARRGLPDRKVPHRNGPHRTGYIVGSFAFHRSSSIPVESSSTCSGMPDSAIRRRIWSCWPTWSCRSDAKCGSNSDRTKRIALAAPDRNRRDTPIWRNPAPG